MNLKLFTLCALLFAIVACDQMEASKPEAAEAEPEITVTSEEDRFSYGLGMMVGERVLKQYGEIDYDLLIAGMRAQHGGETTLITVEEAAAAINDHMQKQLAEQTEANRKRGEDYLKSNAEQEGVLVTDSGLQYSVITEGDGASPAATDEVTVHYRGTLIDGTEFDSSYSRGSPATFALNQVIPGWTEGLQLMKTGSKFRFVIPA